MAAADAGDRSSVCYAGTLQLDRTSNDNKGAQKGVAKCGLTLGLGVICKAQDKTAVRHPETGMVYRQSTSTRSYLEATKQCYSWGGRMATVASDTKENMLVNMTRDAHQKINDNPGWSIWIGCINPYHETRQDDYNNRVWAWDTSFSTVHGSAEEAGVYKNEVVGDCYGQHGSTDKVKHYYGWSKGGPSGDETKRCTVLSIVLDGANPPSSSWQAADCVGDGSSPQDGSLHHYVCEASAVDTATTCPAGQFNSGASKLRIERRYCDEDIDDNDWDRAWDNEYESVAVTHSCGNLRDILYAAISIQNTLKVPDGCISCDDCKFKNDAWGQVVCPECVAADLTTITTSTPTPTITTTIPTSTKVPSTYVMNGTTYITSKMNKNCDEACLTLGSESRCDKDATSNVNTAKSITMTIQGLVGNLKKQCKSYRTDECNDSGWEGNVPFIDKASDTDDSSTSFFR